MLPQIPRRQAAWRKGIIHPVGPSVLIPVRIRKVQSGNSLRDAETLPQPAHYTVTQGSFMPSHTNHTKTGGIPQPSYTPAIKSSFITAAFIAGVFLWKEAALKERQLLRYASAAALFLYRSSRAGAVLRPFVLPEKTQQNERSDELYEKPAPGK